MITILLLAMAVSLFLLTFIAADIADEVRKIRDILEAVDP